MSDYGYPETSDRPAGDRMDDLVQLIVSLSHRFPTFGSIEDYVSVCEGNDKIGKETINFSTVPVRDCRRGVPCARKGLCYALKAWEAYPSVRYAWGRNSEAVRRNPALVVGAIHAYLSRKASNGNPVRYFRWHVAGDFVSQLHVDCAVALAKLHPETSFLAFTKREEYSFIRRPSNFTVIQSLWPGYSCDKVVGAKTEAWVQDGTETYVPDNAFECPGLCADCRHCWTASTPVLFNIH